MGTNTATARVIPTMRLPGTLLRYEQFTSNFVAPRNVDVWLPPDYKEDRSFPVLYMHDGQNLFVDQLSFTRVTWGVAEAMTRLAAEGQARPAIIVGIWNTPSRMVEYMPAAALERQGRAPARTQYVKTFGRLPLSDAYLDFIVQELKPLIDERYRTLQARSDTYIMGSSMGGLISLYAVCQYPAVFGGAACLSTAWPVGRGAVVDYLKNALPPPGAHRFYFDYGTEGLDARYERHQVQVDEIMRAAGYRRGKDWSTRKFSGAADHSEQAWRARVRVPLKFLLGGSAV